MRYGGDVSQVTSGQVMAGQVTSGGGRSCRHRIPPFPLCSSYSYYYSFYFYCYYYYYYYSSYRSVRSYSSQQHSMLSSPTLKKVLSSREICSRYTAPHTYSEGQDRTHIVKDRTGQDRTVELVELVEYMARHHNVTTVVCYVTCCVVWYCAVMCCALPCCAVLCCVVLCCAVLCSAV